MTSKVLFFAITLLLLIVLDLYVFQAVKTVTHDSPAEKRRLWYWVFWGSTFLIVLAFLYFQLTPPDKISRIARNFIATGIFMTLLSKLFVVLFLAVDDVGRFFRWAFAFLGKQQEVDTSRSEFLSKAGLLAATAPMVAMTYGIASGAHDYRVHKGRLELPNLPTGFDGLRLVHISDIHSGSFFSRTAVMGGVQMILEQKPDILLFTGDLVNNQAEEMRDWVEIFGKLKAPLGVFSCLGNHDYGDYVYWPSKAAKQKNLDDLKQIQKEMGWKLLVNEHVKVSVQGDTIALAGVENWSAKGRFPKYGNLSAALQGIEADTTILLSHDPSHWKAEVLPNPQKVDLTLSGHTHGMQFGIELGDFRWSPVQYMYEEWAGLYTQEDRHLYVNRGFGYIGFPGRIGILPEITVLELTRAKS
jgi:hypothetical protein